MTVLPSQPITAEAKSEKTHILWATNMDDEGYADVLFLVGDEPPYGVGINCGGHVIVKPLRDWHALGAAPPEASFDNASDMLEYLDAPTREAGPVTRRQIAEAIADGWTNGNETYEAQNDIMRMRLDHAALAVIALFASPSPIPEAPVGREIDVQIDAAFARGVRAVLNRLAHLRRPQDDTAWKECEAMHRNRTNEICALKPQDGGNCEHGIAKVNCGICVPSKVFSKPQDGRESGQ